jgi:hypothetical protein
LISLSVVGTFLVITPEARAQPVFERELSLDGMILNADVVVVGKVIEFAEGKELQELTIAVEETLRGEHRERRTVYLNHKLWRLGVGGVAVSDIMKWKDESRRLLVALENEPLIVCGLIDLSDAKLRVFRGDLMTVHKPEDVLKGAQEIVRRAPGVKRVDTFSLKLPTKEGKFDVTDTTFVDVPVDERLEKRALEYLGSKFGQQREEGARAMCSFKSDKNVAQLKLLLSDPEWSIKQRAADNRGIEVREYFVREAAYKTLQYWGVNVDKPILREEVRRP